MTLKNNLFLLIIILLGFNNIISQEWTKIGLNKRTIISISAQDSVILAVSKNAGIFLSIDAGNNWEKVNSLDPFSFVLINRYKANEVYALSENNIFLSEDGGSNFTFINSVKSSLLNTLCIDPSQSKAILVGTTSGVWKSFDRGKSFTKAGLQVQNVLSLSLSINSSGKKPVIFAATENSRLFKSSNYGISWIPANTYLPESETTLVLTDLKDPNTSYLCTLQSGVYISTDNIETWNKIELGDNFREFPLIAQSYNSSKNRTILFAVNIFGNISISEDSGKSWNEIEIMLPNVIRTSIGVSPINSSALYIGTIEGIYKFDLQ